MAKVTDVAEAEACAQSLVTRRIDAQNGASVRQLAREAFEPVPGAAESAIETALRQHPRLLALEHAVLSAQRGLAGAQAEHLPQLAMVATPCVHRPGFRQPPVAAVPREQPGAGAAHTAV
jgi:outer membrane protein TolC